MTMHSHLISGECTETGPTTCFRPFAHTDGDGSAHIGGYFFFHDQPRTNYNQGNRCMGTVVICTCKDTRDVWTESGSLAGGDLTISPSILCVNHNFHGFLTDGAWADAQ